MRGFSVKLNSVSPFFVQQAVWHSVWLFYTLYVDFDIYTCPLDDVYSIHRRQDTTNTHMHSLFRSFLRFFSVFCRDFNFYDTNECFLVFLFSAKTTKVENTFFGFAIFYTLVFWRRDKKQIEVIVRLRLSVPIERESRVRKRSEKELHILMVIDFNGVGIKSNDKIHYAGLTKNNTLSNKNRENNAIKIRFLTTFIHVADCSTEIN